MRSRRLVPRLAKCGTDRADGAETCVRTGRAVPPHFARRSARGRDAPAAALAEEAPCPAGHAATIDGSFQRPKQGAMESVLYDAAGHRRSPATMPGYHQGAPRLTAGSAAGRGGRSEKSRGVGGRVGVLRAGWRRNCVRTNESRGRPCALPVRRVRYGRSLGRAARECRDLRALDLDEALGLLVLIAEREPRTSLGAAARFVGCLGLERRLVVGELEHAAGVLSTSSRPRPTPTSAASASAPHPWSPAKLGRLQAFVRWM
jgi:hypothetical protein